MSLELWHEGFGLRAITMLLRRRQAGRAEARAIEGYVVRFGVVVRVKASVLG